MKYFLFRFWDLMFAMNDTANQRMSCSMSFPFIIMVHHATIMSFLGETKPIYSKEMYWVLIVLIAVFSYFFLFSKKNEAIFIQREKTETKLQKRIGRTLTSMYWIGSLLIMMIMHTRANA